MANNLRDKSVKGMIWVSAERFATQGFQFIIGIIIARILSPSDFGIVGMLAIFMAIAQAFLDSGFANALIQKKNRTETDYSTVFYFNIVISLFLYGILYIVAPYIAEFYDIEILKDITRVTSLTLIINGLSIVQTAKLSIDLDFATQAKASICSVIAGGITGIYMAYNGYGVWSLVFSGLMGAFIRTMLLWIISKWRPLMVFSMNSLNELFSFGSKLLCSGMINTIYQNIYSIVIGKAFGAADVGFFNRGKQFATIPTDTVTSIIIKVNYPVLSSLQDDNEKLLNAYKKLLRVPLFLLFPLLIGMAAEAQPLVLVVLGEKWLPCVSVLQILSLGCLWSPMTHTNLNLLYVKGRSDLVLKLELIKKPIAFALLFAMIPFGIVWMCVGRAVYFLIAFYLNCYYTDKLMHYGFMRQIKEVFPILVGSTIMAVAIVVTINLLNNPYTQLVISTTIGLITYLSYSYITKDESLKDLYIIICQKIRNRK